MRTLILISLFLSFSALADYQKSKCFKSFKEAIDKQDARYNEQIKNKHTALLNKSAFYYLIQPEKPIDYRRWILNILSSPYAKETNKIYEYLGDPNKKKYSVHQIQETIKAGFESEDYCGFLKGFGAVKRYVKKHIDSYPKVSEKIDNSDRSISNKKSSSEKENIENLVNQN